MKIDIYNNILKSKSEGRKQFALLIDPDKLDNNGVKGIIKLAVDSKVDFFFIGGSLLSNL